MPNPCAGPRKRAVNSAEMSTAVMSRPHTRSQCGMRPGSPKKGDTKCRHLTRSPCAMSTRAARMESRPAEKRDRQS